ncbi:MAG: hypothetical protein KAR62_06560 [Sphingomonadales bacterium]|nr:hypothetical protein [Sphingomonadales bacterium]
MTKPIEKILTKNKYLFLNPSLSDIKTVSLAEFYKLWLGANKPASLPSYKQFSSELVDEHIDDLAFLKFEPQTHRFKIIKMGRNVIDALGSSILGEYWDSLPGTDEGQARMSWAAQNKLPYYVGWPVYQWGNDKNANYSAINCPLFDEHDEVDGLIMCFAWER